MLENVQGSHLTHLFACLLDVLKKKCLSGILQKYFPGFSGVGYFPGKTTRGFSL